MTNGRKTANVVKHAVEMEINKLNKGTVKVGLKIKMKKTKIRRYKAALATV